jgi:hypothetical protein
MGIPRKRHFQKGIPREFPSRNSPPLVEKLRSTYVRKCRIISVLDFSTFLDFSRLVGKNKVGKKLKRYRYFRVLRGCHVKGIRVKIWYFHLLEIDFPLVL